MSLLDISQRYKLKANHNKVGHQWVNKAVVGYKPKIQIESKSQRRNRTEIERKVVGYKPKIQIESKSQLKP